MSQTSIYKLPLFETYRYSLVYEDFTRPDELDEEATIHQILTYDRENRLVKAENFSNGELVTEKTFAYDGDKIVRETEFFAETDTSTEMRVSKTEEGYRKDFFTDGSLEYSEHYRLNDRGRTVGCRVVDPAGESIRSWEANERGDITRTIDKDGEVIHEYDYDGEDRVIQIVTRASGSESESDEKHETREVLYYEGEMPIRSEIFENGERIAYSEMEYGADGKILRSKQYQGEELVGETAVETDPDGAWMVRLQKQRVRRVARTAVYEDYRTGRVELLFDSDKRITDALASDDRYLDPDLGIDLEAEAYYFFEYEP